MFTYRGKSLKTTAFTDISLCRSLQGKWKPVCLYSFFVVFLRNLWLQRKEGGIFLTVEKHGLRCERHLGGRVVVIAPVLFLRNLAISGFTFFFLAAHRIQGNCYSFLENKSNAYKVLPPQCWAIFIKIWLFFPRKETEFTIKNIQIQLFFCVQ